MASIATRRPSIGIAGPPVLWSVHFVLVYVFVSLACLWGWGDASWLGIGAIEWVVALATLVFGAAIALLGVWAWRDRGSPPPQGVPEPRQRFVAQTGALLGGLFLLATVLVGWLMLPRPACY